MSIAPQSSDESWQELRFIVERHGGGPDGWEQRIEGFLDLLRDRNRGVNLVSRASIDRVLELQVIPSLAGLLVLEPERVVRVLDVGSGGGFPGIPLKILRPSIRLDLVEATQKKARFLVECVERMGLLETRVHACRVEDPDIGLRERAPFEVAFARAVGQERLLWRFVRPLLEQDAPLWIYSRESKAGEYFLSWAGKDGRLITGLRRVQNGDPSDAYPGGIARSSA